MGQYIELTQANFEQEIKDGVVLVDFWAPWCGPCKMLSPVIDKLANDYAGKAKICKVNTDEEGDLATKFGIRSIPSIFFFKNGEVKEQLMGAQPEQTIRQKLDSLL